MADTMPREPFLLLKQARNVHETMQRTQYFARAKNAWTELGQHPFAKLELLVRERELQIQLNDSYKDALPMPPRSPRRSSWEVG